MLDGVPEYLYMFLKNLNNCEYENYLIVSEDYEKQIDKFKAYVKKIHIVPMHREISVKKDLKAVINVKKIIKEIKPDIVYLHSSKAGAIGRIALAFNYKTKILYNAHGWYFNAQISKKKQKIFAIIEKILAIKTNKIINISKNEYESALKNKIASPKKMCTIENGIDFTKFENSDKYREETRKRYNIKDNEIVIGVVGRLTEQKDPMTSIKAFKLLQKQNKNVKFMFIGSGEMENDVLEYAKQNNMENKIIITGWVNNVEKYIPALDIAILPSKWEGFGLVLIEYMACDKPIIASKVGGITNIIKNENNGILIEKEDAESLKKGIEKYINDPVYKNNTINYNKKYVKDKYDIKYVIEKHIKIFEE